MRKNLISSNNLNKAKNETCRGESPLQFLCRCSNRIRARSEVIGEILSPIKSAPGPAARIPRAPTLGQASRHKETDKVIWLGVARFFYAA